MLKRKIPIKRLNRFFGADDFGVELSMGEEWLHGDMDFKLVLFRVDRSKSGDDEVYAESEKNNLHYHPPVEFNGYVQIDSPTEQPYADGLLRNQEAGNLRVSVYIHHLQEKNIDISYGDIIGYYENEDRVRYYSVHNDGKITSANKNTYGGYKRFYRTIEASPVSNDFFNG